MFYLNCFQARSKTPPITANDTAKTADSTTVTSPAMMSALIMLALLVQCRRSGPTERGRGGGTRRPPDTFSIGHPVWYSVGVLMLQGHNAPLWVGDPRGSKGGGGYQPQLPGVPVGT